MTNFINTLQDAFDSYFEKKFAMKELNRELYQEELERFAQFLVEEYIAANFGSDYWAKRRNPE